MSLLQHKSQHWPLALTLVQGDTSIEQHNDSLVAWDAWFAEQEPFHVIRVYLDAQSLNHPEGAAQATQAWMKAGAADKMRELVQSMLIVVPEDQYERMQKMSVRKAFGIPGGLFTSVEAAFAWLDNPLEPVAGLPVDKRLCSGIRALVDVAAASCKKSSTPQNMDAPTNTY